MAASKVNLGCGGVFVDDPDWTNLDFTPVSPRVRQANLLARLPLPSESAQLVYASHFLEHIPRHQIAAFLCECHRVLEPGGVLRLVVPDLQEMARTYVHLRDEGADDLADFLVLEMVDQCVRRESGGELGRLFTRLRSAPDNADDMIAFIRERTGEDLKCENMVPRTRDRNWGLARLRGGVRDRLFRLWLRLWLALVPAAFRAQNVSLASVGERHHWLWDFHQLRQALEEAGFTEVCRRDSASSAIEKFPFYPLDIDSEGRPRKGAESMYVEAQRASGRFR